MQEQLTEQEWNLLEVWHDPVALTECLIPENIKAPHTWDETEDCKCVTIRNYQFAMLNYSYLYVNDPKLSPKENFNRKRISGTCYNIAARDLGKSFFIMIDTFLSLCHDNGLEFCLASCDDQKLKKIAAPIINLCNEHPFFSVFKKSGKTDGIKAQPIEISTMSGNILYGRSENINDPDPGKQFHSIHALTWWYEEFSYATKIGTEKRVDAGTSLGYIERLSGIPDLRVGSPLGDMLLDKRLKKFICRLPQYVRPDWNSQTRDEKIAKYGGRYSTAYKLNVEAEILEGAYGKWDMERIRKKCLIQDKRIRFFEINKELFTNLDKVPDYEKKAWVSEKLSNNLLMVRLPAKQIILASDIGTTGSPSEVAIYFGDGEGNWDYCYQISLFKFTVKEQAYIFDWLYHRLGTCWISLDCSNADGRAIRDELIIEFKIPSAYLLDFRMQQNIEVGFMTDEHNKVMLDKNRKPIPREEYTKEWAVQQLEILFYSGRVKIPFDDKFLNQFGNHFEKRGPTGKPSWGSHTEEHLVDTFLLFGLTVWAITNRATQPIPKQKRFIGDI